MFSEEDTINQLLNNLSDNKGKFSNLKQKKDYFIEKNCCTAAVKYNTIGTAYTDTKNNLNVYLIKEEKNGNLKTNAYSRCSKTTQDGNVFCHLHCRMLKYNSEGLKIFDKDIVPKSSTDKTRWLANINDDFFENMGKRGAKKKNIDNNYVFSTNNNPILLILTHKNVKLLTHLTTYATKLLKTNGSLIQSIQDIEISEKKIPDSKENLMSMMSTIKKESPKKSKKNVDSKDAKDAKNAKDAKDAKDTKDTKDAKSEDEKSEDEKSEDEKSKDEKSKDEKSEDEDSENEKSEDEDAEDEKSEDEDAEDEKSEDEDAEDEKSEDKDAKDEDAKDEDEDAKDAEDTEDAENAEDSEDEGVSCIQINTNNNESLWYDEETNTVYKPDGESDGEKIGFLNEISEEYHTIFHENKFYTVLIEENNTEKGKIYCCVLTDTLFDNDLNFIGSRIKINDKKYKFNFIC